MRRRLEIFGALQSELAGSIDAHLREWQGSLDLCLREGGRPVLLDKSYDNCPFVLNIYLKKKKKQNKKQETS